jgi:predicted transcriptional regulator of viral defense system
VGTKSNIQSKMEAAKSVAVELGVFRANNLVEAGFPRVYLKRLLDRGDIIQVGRGLYAAASFEGDHNQTLLQTAKRFPKGVICLMSALQFHEIGTQAPFEVWLAIPSEMKLPRTNERLLVRFCKFSEATHSFGVKTYKIPGGKIAVYSPAKTVADCFKYRNKYGLDVAVEALREGWRGKKFSLKEITEAAKVCRVAKVMQPYLEMLI